MYCLYSTPVRSISWYFPSGSLIPVTFLGSLFDALSDISSAYISLAGRSFVIHPSPAPISRARLYVLRKLSICSFLKRSSGFVSYPQASFVSHHFSSSSFDCIDIIPLHQQLIIYPLYKVLSFFKNHRYICFSTRRSTVHLLWVEYLSSTVITHPSTPF
uniref:Type 11 methyltransferase n=1 Tax=uncultured marine virus TaxID=186617 RepID=A0A0F7L7P2_9VIRU|nr:type 11 methyltransferase [uncultured marine virus]